MHRRTLILRRFGELSFGLGYIEDGAWVDHSALAARGEDLLAGASATDRAALEAIHAWFSCCEAGAVTDAEATALVAIAGSTSS